MKYHKHLVDSLVTAFDDCDSYPADKVIERQLRKNKRWGARDRRFFAETLYEIVRWKRLLEYLSEDTDLSKMPRGLGFWLAHLIRNNMDLPDFVTLSPHTLERVQERLQSQNLPLSIRESVTDWFFEQGQALENWESLLSELNKKAPVFLRVNSLKATRESVLEALSEENILAEAFQDGIRLTKRANVFRTQSFKKGWFEVQDINSQEIGKFVDAQPGERIIDACAGAGGKALQLACAMENRGKLVALDIHDWKLKELRKRSSRAGVDIIETRRIGNQKVIKRLHETADRVLLDVPCTGSGVLRRNPDSKWKIGAEQYRELIQTQSEILENYSRMVKPGGMLIYSTCSLFPAENTEQISTFLQKNTQFEPLEEKHTLPAENGGDGFYMCKLRRASP